MKNKLGSTAIAAAILATSSSVLAQQATAQAEDEVTRRARETKEAEEAGAAVGQATTTAATTVIEAGQDVSRLFDHPGKYNVVAVSWNPLGLFVGRRVSLNVEIAPLTHHVLVMSPHFASPGEVISSGSYEYTERFTGAGGELGYRYYTGHRGMNGIFIGPSLIGGVYNASLERGDKIFTNVGVAADLGFQHVFLDHVALGAGFGIEYLHVSTDFGDLPKGPSTIATSGVKPRFLVQAGYAF